MYMNVIFKDRIAYSWGLKTAVGNQIIPLSSVTKCNWYSFHNMETTSLEEKVFCLIMISDRVTLNMFSPRSESSVVFQKQMLSIRQRSLCISITVLNWIASSVQQVWITVIADLNLTWIWRSLLWLQQWDHNVCVRLKQLSVTTVSNKYI